MTDINHPDCLIDSQLFSGNTGDLHWQVKKITGKGTLEISGVAFMPEYSSYNEVPWVAQADEIVKIIIEQSCKNILNFAFMNIKSSFCCVHSRDS